LINNNWVTSFFEYDGHGSVRFLTDASGNVTDSFDYDAFGNLINQVGITPNLYLFAGEQYDPDLGLYYNRARYLNVGTGRFWTMDFFEGDSSEPTSLHKYLYASGDPVNKIDPTGNFDTLAGALTAIGVALILTAIATITVLSVVHSLQKSALSPYVLTDRAYFVKRTVEFALAALKKGNCVTDDLPDDPNIQANESDYNFAKIINPDAVIDKSWHDAFSLHGVAKESPPIPSASNFAVKYYKDPKRGQVIAIVHPTSSFAHDVDAFGFLIGGDIGYQVATEARPYLVCNNE
jgi:RHS repeat-associated protein